MSLKNFSHLCEIRLIKNTRSFLDIGRMFILSFKIYMLINTKNQNVLAEK